MKKGSFLVLAVAGLLLSGRAAQATSITYGFGCITPNAAAECAIAPQLSVTVSDVVGQPGQVDFTFNNAGPVASSIADVYFDDGTLLGIASITNGSGVAFSQGASPGDLPGGQGLIPPFVTTAGFLADSDSPVQQNGVNPGQFVTIRFNLIGGNTYGSTIAALNGATDLRIGIHVQAIDATGGSASFVNTPGTPVPEPGTLLLLGAGLAGLGRLRRRS